MKTATKSVFPRSLSAMHQAVVAGLDEILAGAASEVLEARRRLGTLVLRANLPALARLDLRMAVGGGDLSLHSRASRISISLEAFRSRTTVAGDRLTLVLANRTDRAWTELREAVRGPGADLLDTFVQVAKVSRQPGRSVFVRRALRALLEISEQADVERLEDAASASFDLSVLLRALEHPEIVERLRAKDPLAPAVLRGIEGRQKLLESHGRPLSTAEVASLLGITRQAVHKRRKANQLLGVSLGRRDCVFPSWQFGEKGTLRGLDSVLAALRDHDDWMKLAFLLNASTALDGRTPLDAMKRGRVDGAVSAARAYGTHGAE